MATLLFANNATTTLAGPLSTTSTTCNVAAGSGALFPQPGAGQYFKMTFIDAQTKTLREIVHVTAVSGDTFTITRGQESTTQLNWNAGDIAANLITAGTFATFAQLGNLPTSFVTGQDSGTANAVQVATTTPAVSTPSPGQLFLITKGSNSNTGGTTFQIASGTAYSVVYQDGSALNGYDWPAGSAALLYFTGGVMQYLANMGNYGVKTYFGRATGTADALVLATTPPVPVLGDNVDLEFVNVASANKTATPTLAVGGLGAKTVYRNDGSACQATDLPANALVSVKYDSVLNGGCWRLRSQVAPGQVRIKLSGNLNLYVRSDGSDTNNGLANTSAGAFATPQGCWNAIFGLYDPAGFVITINVGVGIAGTYGPIYFNGYTGSVVLAGDPSNVATLNSGTGANSVLTLPAGANVTTQNLRLDFSYAGTEPPVEATVNNSGNFVVGAGMTFNCSTNRTDLYEIVSVGSGATVTFADNTTVTVSGSGLRNSFLNTSSGSSMRVGIAGGPVQFVSSGTITYLTFSVASSGSTQNWTLARFGSFTGTGNHQAADGNAVIQLGGQTLPGNTTAPTPTHGGQVY